jgi:hypothetical protein
MISRNPTSMPAPLLREVTRTAGLRPVDYLFRAAVVHLKAEKRDLSRVAKQLYGDDKVTPEVIERATSVQATVANPTWAGAIAEQVVGDLLQSIVSISAGAALLTRAQQIAFDRKQSIRLPSRLVDPAYAGVWSGEGQAIPVFQFPVSSGVTLTPHKLNVITLFTREMIDTSNIDAFVRSLLSESAALALDKALFGTQADDGITPPGLLHGVAAITASAATTGRRDAMAQDVENLVQAIAVTGGGSTPAFVCAAAQATAMKLLASPKFDYPIFASMVLPAGTCICVETRSVVATINNVVPEFSVAEATLLQMDNSAPVDVVAGSPTRSVFQLDSLALKMSLRNVDWKMRAPHVSWVQNTNW